MLGHVLRYEDDAPAYLSLKFSLFAEENKFLFKGRLGAPCTNLLNVFRSDIKKRKLNNELKTLSDLHNLRLLAMDRVAWKKLCCNV